MVQIYSNSNSGIPIGRVADYNNTNPSRAITSFRNLAKATNPVTINPQRNDFASAVYGDGPYSLTMPNQASDILALNIDYIA